MADPGFGRLDLLARRGRTADRGSSAGVVSTLVESRSSATHHPPCSPSSVLLVHSLSTLAVIGSSCI